MPSASNEIFLSHLCGEEARLALEAFVINFLSHLCGEEAQLLTKFLAVTFLSHLCGEEVGF